MIVAVGCALAGCAGTPGAPGPASTGGTGLEQAMGRVHAPFADYLEFTDPARAAGWPALAARSGGGLAAHRADLAATLKIDLGRAAGVLTAGQPPRGVTLVLGGQDASAVRAAAGAAGWSGTDVLSRELALDAPLTLVAGAVRPIGSDVALGGPNAAVAAVDGPGAALSADPVAGPLARCLGDPAVAVMSGGTQPVGVGLRAVGDPAAADAVLCVAAGSAAQAVAAGITGAVATKASRSTGKPYATYLASPHVEQLDGGVVRMVARTAPGAPVAFLVDAATRRDLPGVTG